MAEILGLGLTHYPPLASRDERMAELLRLTLRDPGLPEKLRTPAGWPEPMRREYAEDGGTATAARHREAIIAELRKQRAILDEFRPDFVVVWGDDQYENFRESVIPPFCVLAYDSVACQPWAKLPEFLGPNVWNEPRDHQIRVGGHRSGAKALATALLEQGFDCAYAYEPLHHPGLPHAFLNTVLYLDWDRRGFPHPVVPFQINCYGRRVISARGGMTSLADPLTAERLDPPSPSPRRCFDLGAATARALAASPWRVALVASSSWSHAFLVEKNHYIHPDIDADRELYEALRRGDYTRWQATSLAAVEESGQQEMLNWFALVGAMAELGRKPDECSFVETWVLNSNKCFAVFRP
jgi:catalytic LigB subunit of aromatic ring-opening dioxygenase